MPERRHIRLLSEQVANKIAAGEVVDRPASVLKELIENALDAGAPRIDVEVTAGGRKLIQVADDGCGMDRDDALLSLERHATSKIADVEDIERIATLGFRGEALAAIASVSQFTMVTRTSACPVGTEVVVHGGRIQDVREIGGPVGTTISVRHLFYNVPARRKFLRSEQTEFSHIRQTFVVYALSHPGTAFRLLLDGRELYRLPGGAALGDRIRELFGPETFAALRAVEFAAPRLRITGFAGLPQTARSDRSAQFIFINHRPAGAPVIAHAISEAYHTLLPHGRHPALFLQIEMEPGQVDVNVHPTKKEVRFRDSSEIRDALIQALKDALQRPLQSGTAAPAGAVAALTPVPAMVIEDLPQMRAFAYPRLTMLAATDTELARASAGAPERSPVESPSRAGAPWSWCRVLGQVGGLYVVLETGDGLVLMDPHAAHERILFERLMREVAANRVRSQGLLAPETVELPPDDARCVRENIERLRSLGFSIAEFGSDAFLVDAMPQCLGAVTAREMLGEVARAFERAGGSGAARWSEERVVQAACKAAVKARDHLTVQELEELVVALAGAEMPYTCPHGRPTIIFMSYSELNRKFGRE